MYFWCVRQHWRKTNVIFKKKLRLAAVKFPLYSPNLKKKKDHEKYFCVINHFFKVHYNFYWVSKFKIDFVKYVNGSIRQRLNNPFCTRKIEAQTGTVAGYVGLFVGDTGLEPKPPNLKSRPLFRNTILNRCNAGIQIRFLGQGQKDKSAAQEHLRSEG